MLQWLKRLFRNRQRFTFPQSGVLLPECKIRPIRADDISHCEAIYRLNEPSRFPEGNFDYFSKWIRSNTALILVVEVAGEVRGVGGIQKMQQDKPKVAWLSFGMIHPSYHRKGFGTALLLARFSTLPMPNEEWWVAMMSVGKSYTFYRRFGFAWYSCHYDGEGNAFDCYQTRILKPEWDACRARLQQANITVDIGNTYIPTSFAEE